MAEELPNGWNIISLFEFTESVKTGVKEYPGERQYFATGSISESVIKPEGTYNFNDRPSRANRQVKEFDLLQARMQNTDKALFVNAQIQSSIFSTGFMQLRPRKEISYHRYVFYFLKSKYFNDQKDELATGTTQVSINDSNIKKILIPVPPFNEQKRIAEKLDALFEHLDNLKTKLDRIPELLKNFRQKVLSQAVTGELNGNKYDLKPLGDFYIKVQTGPFGSALHKHEYIDGGVPVINPSHIKNGVISPNHEVSISLEKLKELERWKLEDGDVIIGRRGEMGRAARFVGDQTMICGTGSLVFKKSADLNPDFLSIYLRSPFTVNYLEMNSVGSTMINLNQKIIKSLPFPKVSQDAQTEIVEHVERLFSISERIESQYQSLKEKINNLPQAILNKALKGELVSQDPKDEPAGVLLEKLKNLERKLKIV